MLREARQESDPAYQDVRDIGLLLHELRALAREVVRYRPSRGRCDFCEAAAPVPWELTHAPGCLIVRMSAWLVKDAE